MNKDISPALDEITAVLKKHDMTGLVIIGNQTHCAWRMNLEASRSCARVENGEGIRLQCMRADFPSREAQQKSLTATLVNFVTFGDILDLLRRNVDGILVMASKQVQFIGRSTHED